MVLLAAGGLGLSAGALLAEGGVLVPAWRSMAPDDFLSWYRHNAGLLLRFFGPLEIVPAIVVVLAAALSLHGGRPGGGLLALSSLLALGVLSSFPVYFRAANESFAAGTLGADEVSAELRRWSRWHWGRTSVSIAAFFAALLALLR